MTPSRKVHALIAAVAGGNTQAFEELYRLSCPKLYGLALRVLRQPDLAASAMRRAFVQVRIDAARLSPQEDAVSFLVARLRAATFDIARTGAGIDAWEPFEVDNPARDPLALDGRSPALTRLLGCLGALPEERRRMLLLAYYDGWGRDALALVFDAPIAVVRALIARSVDQLAECLGKKPVPPGLTDADRHMAAEYALGTLDADERAAVRARMEVQPDFGKQVRLWERRLAPLHELAATVAPPPGLWTAIAGDMRRRPVAAAVAAPSVQPAPVAEAPVALQRKETSRPPRGAPRRQGLFSFMLERVTGKSGGLTPPRAERGARPPRVETPAVVALPPPPVPPAASGASATASADAALPLLPPVSPPPPRRSANAPRQPVRRAIAPKAPAGPPLEAEARAAAFRALAEAIDLRIGAGTEGEPAEPAVPPPEPADTAPAMAGRSQPAGEGPAGPVDGGAVEPRADVAPADAARIAASATPSAEASAGTASPAGVMSRGEDVAALREAVADAVGAAQSDARPGGGPGDTVAVAPASAAVAVAATDAVSPDAVSAPPAGGAGGVTPETALPAEPAAGAPAFAGATPVASESAVEPSTESAATAFSTAEPTELPVAEASDGSGAVPGPEAVTAARAAASGDERAGASEAHKAAPIPRGTREEAAPERQSVAVAQEAGREPDRLLPPPTFRFIEPVAPEAPDASADAGPSVGAPEAGPAAIGDGPAVVVEAAAQPRAPTPGDAEGALVASSMPETAGPEAGPPEAVSPDQAPVLAELAPPGAPPAGPDAVTAVAAVAVDAAPSMAEPGQGPDLPRVAAAQPGEVPVATPDPASAPPDVSASSDALTMEAAAPPAAEPDTPDAPLPPRADSSSPVPVSSDATTGEASPERVAAPPIAEPDAAAAPLAPEAGSPPTAPIAAVAGLPPAVPAGSEALPGTGPASGEATGAEATVQPAAEAILLPASAPPAEGAAVRAEPVRPALPLPPPVFKSATAAPVPVEEKADPVRSVLAASRARWRRAAMVLSVLVAGLGGLTLYRLLVPPAGERWVALLQQEPTPALTVRLDPQDGAVRVQVQAPDLPAGGRYALWLVTEKSGTHLLSRFSGSVVVHSATLRRLGHAGLGNATLTVTVEPAQAAAVPLAPGTDVVYRGRLAPE